MQIKASNPYSQSENPISWAGWEAGFKIDDPNWEPNQAKKDQFSREFWQAFYRGQGSAQIVKNYECSSSREIREIDGTLERVRK